MAVVSPAPPAQLGPWDLLVVYVRTRLGRCPSCGRHMKPEGPCAPGECWLLGPRMRRRLYLREAAR